MAEFVVKLADERGRVSEQVQAASSAEELRQRFSQAGYLVYSVKPHGFRSSMRKKVKLETFLVFNQQFLTLVRAGIAHSGLAGDAGQRPEKPDLCRATRRCNRPRAHRRIALRRL